MGGTRPDATQSAIVIKLAWFFSTNREEVSPLGVVTGISRRFPLVFSAIANIAFFIRADIGNVLAAVGNVMHTVVFGITAVAFAN